MKGPDDDCRAIKINDLFVYDNLGQEKPSTRPRRVRSSCSPA